MTEPVVTATEVVDAFVGDDGAVVLVVSGGQHHVLRLSAVAQAIRDIAVTGVPMSRLTEELLARFGDAGADPAAEVAALVAQLQSAGLVRVES